MDAPRNRLPPEGERAPSFDPSAGSLVWGRASAAETGLDAEQLRLADEAIRTSYPKIRCFVVAKDAQLVFERYYGGADAATAFDLRSATKSATAAAAACAGLFGARAPALGELFPADLPRTASEALLATTALDLLAMASGLHWASGPRLGEPFVPRMHRSRHWVRFALRLPVRPELQGVFLYRSADSHLLSAAVTAATNRPAAEIAQEAIFGPLGIAAPGWDADPQGHTVGHIGLRLTGEALAKFGWLHATGGVWEGRRLLPAEYVRLAWTPRGDGLPAFGRYGGHWWVARAATGDVVRCALGHGGQLVFAVPERRLVAAFAAEPKVSRWKHPLALFERYVLAADGTAAVPDPGRGLPPPADVCNSGPFGVQ